MQKINYSRILEGKLDELKKEEKTPQLLLHACCAPCSSSVIEYLEDHFDITVFFYNPNITDRKEYEFRLDEIRRFLEIREGKETGLIVPEYDPDEFFRISKGYENAPERGERCSKCFDLRLDRTALYAVENGYRYFATTLTLSPLKNADMINRSGLGIADKYEKKSVYLVSDFKKKNGYLRSIELSEKYGLYRQNYCGCIYSKG